MEGQESPVDSLQLVYEVLKELDLENYFVTIRDDLNVTRLAHFEFVKPHDLTEIGMSRPAIRRLLDAVRKKRSLSNPGYLNGFVNLLLPKRKHQSPAGKPRSDREPLYANSNLPQNGVVSCLVNMKDIKLKEKLGQGTFGEVLKAEWTRSDGQVVDVAVKILRSDALALPGAFGDFVKEVNAMIGLHHPNIIELYGVSLSSPYMIVQELAPLGSVLDRLRKECSLTSVAVIFEWAKQICHGMAFLESKRWIHRDLAARNVLLAAIDKIKIGDFGLMKSIQPDQDCYVMTEHKKIPFPWCAPESLKLRQFSHASDCWAYGVTLWELFTFGEHPWAGNTGAQILQLIDQEGKRLPKPKACPAELYSVMLHCWSHRHQDRPTFAALAQFFSAMRLEELKALKSLDEPDRLQLNQGDDVTIIDGRPENHWWIGQNKRTYHIGSFPRNIMTPFNRKKNVVDISKPLRNSFIHAGHGDMDPKKSFGNPAMIDDIFLRNPIPAFDLLTGPETSPAPIEIDVARLTLPKLPGNVHTAAPSLSEPSSRRALDLLDATTSLTPKNTLRSNSRSDSDLTRAGSQSDHLTFTCYSNDSDMLSAPAYGNVQPVIGPLVTKVSPPASLPLPRKPETYANILSAAENGLFSGYSNAVIPTGSPVYSPHSYYNTATFLVHPPSPLTTSVMARPVAVTTSRSSNLFKRQEPVIKTVAIPMLDVDPFDTSDVDNRMNRLQTDEKAQNSNTIVKPGNLLGSEAAAWMDGLLSSPNSAVKDTDPWNVSQTNLQPALAVNSSDNEKIFLGLSANLVNASKKGSVTPLGKTPAQVDVRQPSSLTDSAQNSMSSFPVQSQYTSPSILSPPNATLILGALNSPSLSSGSCTSRSSWTSSGSSVVPVTTDAACSVLDDLVQSVGNSMPGENPNSCRAALQDCHFDVQKTVKALKLQRLMRLGVAPEEKCRKMLEHFNWDLEKAGEAIL